MLGQKALRPADVVADGDGVCSRPFTRYNEDGSTFQKMIRVCERCWQPIPVYVDAPNGWVSPDSNRKLQFGTYEGKAAIHAQQKIVCYECLKQDHLEVFGAFADIPHEIK